MEEIADSWADFCSCDSDAVLHIEDPYFLQALKITRPGIDVKFMPRRRVLGGAILDKKYNVVMQSRMQLEKARSLTILAHEEKAEALQRVGEC